MPTERSPLLTTELETQALSAIDVLVEFAYEHGFHELGHPPNEDIRVHIKALRSEIAALRAQLADAFIDALVRRRAARALTPAAPSEPIIAATDEHPAIYRDGHRLTAHRPVTPSPSVPPDAPPAQEPQT